MRLALIIPPARVARSLVIAAAALVGACADESHPAAAAPPLPELSAAEPAVAERVREAHAKLRNAQTDAGAWGRYGMVLDAHDFGPEAIAAFTEAQRLDGQDYRWPYYRGVAWRATDPREAAKHLAEALELAPNQPHVMRSCADTFVSVDRAAEAEALYESILAIDPAHRGALLGLGELALRQGDVGKSLGFLRRALDIEFRDHEAHEKLARAYQRGGDETAARRHAALAAAYPHPAAVIDPDLAARDAEAVSSKALSARGLALVRRGAHAEAVEVFRRLVQICPDNARHRANYAGALHTAGRMQDALAEFRAALRLSEHDAETFAAYAVALVDAGRPADAERYAHEAVRLNPQADEPHHTLGSIRQAQGRFAEAEAEFRRAIELNPVHARAYNNLGNVLAAQGRMTDACAAWRAAGECGLHVPEAYYNLSMASYLAGDMAEAARTLTDALRRFGDQPMLLAGLAAIRATAPAATDRNGEEAIALTNRLVRAAGGTDAATADLLAAAFAEAGRWDDAVTTAQLALKLAREKGDAALAAQVEGRLALYAARQPYHQQPGAPYRPPQPRLAEPPRGWRR